MEAPAVAHEGVGLPESYVVAGNQYRLDDDYFATIDRARPLAEIGILPVYEGDALAVHESKQNDIRFIQFLGKYYESALLMDALARVGKDRRFSRVLDIGAGPALQSRALRLAGRAQRVEAIDIYDGSARCSEGRMRWFAALFAALYPLWRLERATLSPVRARSKRLNRIEEKLPYGVESFGYRPELRHFGRCRPRLRTLDAYHVGDVFDQKGQYDCVTSFMALDYFDFDRIAAKVATLLEPGGIFGFIVSYWWYPINNTLLFGRLPYLLQQLTVDEVLEYYREHHPALPMDTVRRRLTYSDPKRRTIADYQDTAFAAGLVCRAAVRLAPPPETNPRAVLGPLAINRRPGAALDEVARRAKRINPRVGISDLMTSHILMVFEKK